MQKEWDGKTERRQNTSDHDSLTRTLVMLEGLIKSFDHHVLDDNRKFDAINGKIDVHAKYIYIGIGVCIVLEVILGIHK